MSWMSKVHTFLAQVRNFSLFQNKQTGSWTHPASSPMGISSYFPRVKQLGHDTDHSHPSSAKVEYERSYASPNLMYLRGMAGTTSPLPFAVKFLHVLETNTGLFPILLWPCLGTPVWRVCERMRGKQSDVSLEIGPGVHCYTTIPANCVCSILILLPIWWTLV